MALPHRILDQRNPAYSPLIPQWEALYRGGEPWHAMVETWLPKNPHEDPELWRSRTERATYENNVGPICGLVAGGLFTKPPIIADYDTEWFDEFTDNVDGNGTSLNMWLEQRLLDAMVGRRVFAWVRTPDTAQQFETLAQQTEAGALDAVLAHATAEQVLDWAEDDDGALAWAVVRTITSSRVEIDGPRRKVWTWRHVDATTVRTWQWTATAHQDEPDDEDMIEELPPRAHGCGEIPLVLLQLPTALHTVGQLHDPAVALVRAQADLDWGLHMGAHAILWWRSKWDDEAPIVGAGAYFRLGRDKDGEDSMGYAEPSGVSFELLADRIGKQREGMYRVVHQMASAPDGNATRTQLSAASKAQDWRATEISMSDYATVMRSFIRKVLRLLSKVRSGQREDITPSVGGLAGWHDEGVAPWLGAAAQALDAMRMSETFHRVIAKEQARRLLPHIGEATLAQIETEIDAAEIDLDDYAPVAVGADGDGAFGDGE